MRIDRRVLALCATACLHSALASAQEAPLTLADVLIRARERAPQVAIARLTLEETRGRLIGATRRFQSNPDVDLGIASRRRNETGEHVADVQVGLAQMFEPGSRRSARLAGARAALDQGTADIEDTTRVVIGAAAEAFYRVLHADERLRLLRAAQDLATSVAGAAERRFAAGDIAVLDVNLARITLARVRADIAGAHANRSLVAGALQQVLGLDQPVVVTGSLSTGLSEPDLNALLASATTRPDVLSLEAGVREAAAEQQLGESMGRPDYGVGARYSREERDQVVMGTFTITLPVFAKGQDLVTTGQARTSRLRTAAEAARRAIRTEVVAAYEAYRRRLAAVRLLEGDALTSVDDSLALAARSYEVGQIGLPDVLLLRRELLDARYQHLDALLEAALARVSLDASAGVLR